MPHQISGGGRAEGPSYKMHDNKLTRAIVVEDVRIIEKRVEVPVYSLKEIPREQIKYETKTETQTRYVTKEVETVRYEVKEKDTTKFRVKEEETIKYIPKEIEVERPVIVPKEYEKPVVREKVVDVVSVSDLATIKTFVDYVPKLVKAVDELQKRLEKVVNYKLVEKVIEAPVIQWINTPVERIVWKDVVREKINASKS